MGTAKDIVSDASNASSSSEDEKPARDLSSDDDAVWKKSKMRSDGYEDRRRDNRRSPRNHRRRYSRSRSRDRRRDRRRSRSPRRRRNSSRDGSRRRRSNDDLDAKMERIRQENKRLEEKIYNFRIIQKPPLKNMSLLIAIIKVKISIA